MINSLLTGIFKLIISLVNLLLLPIDNLIDTFLPDLSVALTSIGTFLQLCFSSIGWCISALGIPSLAISFIVMYFGIKLTAPLLFSTIKLAMSWYNRLKP